jgi:hypothetical protein
MLLRSRHAVVHPWGPNPGPDAPGKELYLIPILPHEALPDYVEILDLVKFPKQREEKMLLGVFILNKGKFSERVPFVTPLGSAAVGIPRSDIISSTPGMPTALRGPPSSNASLIPASQTTQQPPNIPPEIVSKLTAEQIESLLQSVLSGGLNASPVTHSQSAAPPTSTAFASAFPNSLVNLLPQQYPSVPFPSYPPTGAQGPQYPPPPPPQPPPMPYNYSPPHMYEFSSLLLFQHN